MDLLVGQGVRFLVCEQALRSRNSPPEIFPDYVSTVPSGIVELVVRQAEGWCYLRP